MGNNYARITPFNEGMVSEFVCHNAQTCEKHIEKDCSYTMIGSPITSDDINTGGNFLFEFEWNADGGMIQVKLGPGNVLYYSGFAIMHRQISFIDKGRNFCDYNFWNLSTYANKRFYSNVMMSFKRLMHS